MGGENVAEVARRDREIDLLRILGHGKIALEVIHNLRRDPRPVDGVDRAQAVAFLERRIAADGLDEILAVVENALDRQVEDVGVGQRIHLRGLERAHAALGREHEDLEPALAAQRVLGGGAGVAGGRAEDVQGHAVLRHRILEQSTEELQGDVLERQRRAPGDAQQMQPRLERAHRRDVLAAERRRGVGTQDDRLEVSSRDVVGVARKDRQRQPAVRERPQASEFGDGERRVGLGHDQAAVGREAFEQD